MLSTVHVNCDFHVFPHEIPLFMNFFVFLSGIVIFYCGTWGNMKRCLFLLVFAVNFNVSMKRHMLIVSLFFARCCFNFISLLQHVLFQSFWFSCFPTRNSTFHESRCFFNRKSTGFTAARGVILRAGVFLLVFVFLKHETGHVDSYLFLLVVVSTSTPCCNMLEHVLFQSFHVPWTWR